MTRAELVAEIRGNLDNRDDKDTEIVTWINQALKRVARRHRWKDLEVLRSFTTTADQKRESFPSDMLELVDMRLQDGANSRGFVQLPLRAFDLDVPRPEESSTGRPKYYVREGDVFELYPIPDAAYTIYIRFYKWPDELLVDSDEPQINNIDDVLVASATAYGFSHLRQFDVAASWEALFQQRLGEAVAHDSRNPDLLAIHRGFRLTGGAYGFACGDRSSDPYWGMYHKI